MDGVKEMKLQASGGLVDLQFRRLRYLKETEYIASCSNLVVRMKFMKCCIEWGLRVGGQ